jgi:hypothetical protein
MNSLLDLLRQSKDNTNWSPIASAIEVKTAKAVLLHIDATSIKLDGYDSHAVRAFRGSYVWVNFLQSLNCGKTSKRFKIFEVSMQMVGLRIKLQVQF